MKLASTLLFASQLLCTLPSAAQVNLGSQMKPELVALVNASSLLDAAHAKGEALAPPEAVSALESGCGALQGVVKSRDFRDDLERLEKSRGAANAASALLARGSLDFLAKFALPESQILLAAGVPETTRLHLIVFASQIRGDDVAKHGQWKAGDVVKALINAADSLCGVATAARKALRDADSAKTAAAEALEHERLRKQITCGIIAVGSGGVAAADVAAFIASMAGTVPTGGASAALLPVASGSVVLTMQLAVESGKCFSEVR